MTRHGPNANSLGGGDPFVATRGPFVATRQSRGCDAARERARLFTTRGATNRKRHLSGCDAQFSGIDEPKLRDVTRTLRNVQDTLRSRGIVTRDTVRASSVVAPLSPPRVASTPERATKIRRRGRDPVDATTATPSGIVRTGVARVAGGRFGMRGRGSALVVRRSSGLVFRRSSFLAFRRSSTLVFRALRVLSFAALRALPFAALTRVVLATRPPTRAVGGGDAGAPARSSRGARRPFDRLGLEGAAVRAPARARHEVGHTTGARSNERETINAGRDSD